MIYKHKYVDINYHIEGEGPLMLCVHGYRVNHLFIKNFVIENLDGHKYKRIHFDLPGMGKSILKEHIPSADVMAQVIFDFVKDIIKEEPFIIVANSYGAYLSQSLIYKLDTQVKAAFFMAPVTIADLKKRTINIEKRKKPELEYQGINEEYFKDYLNTQIVLNDDSWIQYQRDVIPGIIETNSEFAKNYRHNLYDLSYEADMKLKDNNMKTIIILGRQDAIVGVEDCLAKLDNYKNSTTIILSETGHNPQIDHPETLSFIFKGFLNDIKELF